MLSTDVPTSAAAVQKNLNYHLHKNTYTAADIYSSSAVKYHSTAVQ